MKKLDEASLQSIMDDFIKPGIVQITKEDLDKFKDAAQFIYYSEYLADDRYRAVRIGERIRCDLAEFGSNNSAALYFEGKPDMDEVAEILDGLHGKANEIFWGSSEETDLKFDVLSVALLFFDYGTNKPPQGS